MPVTSPAPRRLTRWIRSATAQLSAAALLASVVIGHGAVPATADSATVKPTILGLIDRQGEPPRTMLPVVHAYVVKVNWADLQPTQHGPIVVANAIDRAIARVREADYAQLGMVLKLRVLAGINAPAWAKALGGAALPYVDNQPGASTAGGTIGRFWTPAFEAAYAELQVKLAAKYDSVPEIREVTVSSCTTVFDEPFVRQVGSQQNRQSLLGAGYTVEADRSCIANAFAAHDVWQHTTSDVDFAPFPLITAPNSRRDLPFTLAMMASCRAVLGTRCGLQNNALSTEKLADPDFSSLYGAMTALGGTVVFQTAALKRLGSAQQVLDAAMAMHADSLELPAGYAHWPLALLENAERGLHGTVATAAAKPRGGHR